MAEKLLAEVVKIATARQDERFPDRQRTREIERTESGKFLEIPDRAVVLFFTPEPPSDPIV